MSVPASMMGGPPPGLAQLPMGPPGMGAPPPPPMGGPMGGGDPISQLSSAAAGLTQAGQSTMMILAELLGQQASPEAIGAQSSPGPMMAPAPGGPDPELGGPQF